MNSGCRRDSKVQSLRRRSHGGNLHNLPLLPNWVFTSSYERLVDWVRSSQSNPLSVSRVIVFGPKLLSSESSAAFAVLASASTTIPTSIHQVSFECLPCFLSCSASSKVQVKSNDAVPGLKNRLSQSGCVRRRCGVGPAKPARSVVTTIAGPREDRQTHTSTSLRGIGGA